MSANAARRIRATKADIAERQDKLVAIALEHGPCSVRHVFYRAVVGGIEGITKDRSGYEKVQREVLRLRRQGRIPYRFIVDNSRTVFRHDTYSGPDDFLAEIAELYRRDLWRTTNLRVELWCESDSIASTVWPVASKWRVPVLPTRGQTSETFARAAVEQWTSDRTPVVLYVGDHDPAGLEIEDRLKAKLMRFAEDDGLLGDGHIEWTRIGVTWEQAEALDLPGTPPKKPYGYPLSVEAEALPPQLLRELIEDELSSYVDPVRLAQLEAVEDEERQGLYQLADYFGGAA